VALSGQLSTRARVHPRALTCCGAYLFARLSLRCIPRYPRPAPSFASPRCPRHALCGQWRRVQCASACGRSRRVGCLLSGRTRRTRPAGVCVVLSSVGRDRACGVSLESAPVCPRRARAVPCLCLPAWSVKALLRVIFQKTIFRCATSPSLHLNTMPPLHINRASSMWCHSLVRMIAAAASISALYTAARLVRRRLGES
jgi:hypothetical protein